MERSSSHAHRSGGTVLFLFAIVALVAGAGAAGLHYRDRMWDDYAHHDQSAAPVPDPE